MSRLLLMAGSASKFSKVIKKPMVRRFSGLLIIVIGLVVLWTLVKTLASDSQHPQHNEFLQSTDLDYLA